MDLGINDTGSEGEELRVRCLMIQLLHRLEKRHLPDVVRTVTVHDHVGVGAGEEADGRSRIVVGPVISEQPERQKDIGVDAELPSLIAYLVPETNRCNAA